MNTIQSAFWSICRRIVLGISRTGVPPNAVTVTGCLLQSMTGWFFYQGHWTEGALLLLLSSPLDALDGALARQTGRVTSFGAFLDSTLDRISDMAVFAGILFFFTSIQSHLLAGLALYSLVTAMMISYTKARAENLVPACGAGFARRPERIALLILGGFFHQMPLAIGWLALLNTLTFLRRMRQAWLQCRGDDSGRFTREAVFFADFGRGNTLYYCTWLVIFISLLIPSLF